MFPAQPPLPTAWNFPFQASAGSQTSILMSESDEGVSVAATRQKAGSCLNCDTGEPVPGRVNSPAGTIWAKVSEVFGIVSEDKLAHDAAALMPCPFIISARRVAHDPPITSFIALSSEYRARRQRYEVHSQEFLFSHRLQADVSLRTMRAHGNKFQ